MFFNVLPNEDDDPDALITFWNPYDLRHANLSNRRQTLTCTVTGIEDDWQGGWENMEINSGKVYFEIEVAQLDVDPLGITVSMECGWRNSQDGLSTAAAAAALTTIIYLGPEQHQIARWTSNILTPIAGSNTLTTTATGGVGYEEGDILMFAMNYDTGKAWIGKNGTWINSGDPAAGTGEQWSGFLSGRSYRFWASGRGLSSPAILNARFGGTIFPQEYAAPSGFSSLIPKAANQVYGGWNVRSKSVELRQPNNNLTNDNFLYGMCLFINIDPQYGETVGRMRVGEKFYFEAILAVDVGDILYSLGVSPLGVLFPYATWKSDGTLFADGGAVADSTDVVSYTAGAGQTIGFAVDVSAGKMWLRKPGGDWTNSGNPTAGTNPQFTNIPVTELCGYVHMEEFSGSVYLLHPSNYEYATPDGFTTGLPLHPLGLQ